VALTGGAAGARSTPVLLVRGSASETELAARLPDLLVRVITTPDDLADQGSADAVALVVRSGFRLGPPELARLPALRAVIRPGSGTDNLDLETLGRRGIAVRRAPEIGAGAVGEWAVLAALALSRLAALGSNGLRSGHHLKGDCLGTPLAEQRIAIWGAGPVGRAIGAALGPLVREVWFAAWPSVPASLPQREPGWLCAHCDCHVVALPLRDRTRAMFGHAWLTAVGPARPAVICAGRLATLDLPALVTALRQGHLSGVALDPLEPADVAPVARWLAEPLNLFVTPHIGAQRADVRRRYDAWVADELRRLLAALTGQCR
jgi:D-3-phosphoglycerate dehydrogenase